MFIHKVWAVDQQGYCTCSWSWTKTVYALGPKRIFSLQVVDENGYEIFPHEGYAINRGWKRICLTDCTRGYILPSPHLSRAEVPLKINTSLARGEVLLLRIYLVPWWQPHPDGSMKKNRIMLVYLGKVDKIVGSDAKNFVAWHPEF